VLYPIHRVHIIILSTRLHGYYSTPPRLLQRYILPTKIPAQVTRFPRR
jgi:hypothetical protein